VLREDAASPDLMTFNMARGRRLEPLVQTPFRELNADFSPDGQFLTYQSNESGQDEVYVQPFPIVGTKRWMISSGGGRQPMWANDGRELFYVTRTGGMMSVPIRRQGGGFAMGAPTKLFEGRYYFGVSSISGRTYDVSPRDGRFLLMKSVSERMQSATEIEVVLNWFEELKHTLRN
jgi:eukaryotic-like serine/threonine-protein kinase